MKWFYTLKIDLEIWKCPIFDSSPPVFGARYQSVLRVCWFLHKGVPYFGCPSEQLNNPTDITFHILIPISNRHNQALKWCIIYFKYNFISNFRRVCEKAAWSLINQSFVSFHKKYRVRLKSWCFHKKYMVRLKYWYCDSNRCCSVRVHATPTNFDTVSILKVLEAYFEKKID